MPSRKQSGFVAALVFACVLVAPQATAHAQVVATESGVAAVAQRASITIQLPGADGKAPRLAPALEMLVLLTLLAVAPALLVSMTAFTRIIIVLSFLRQALGVQNIPPMQVLLALSVVLTGVVMAPTFAKLNETAIRPYNQETISQDAALTQGSAVMKEFMLGQTREQDLVLFHELAGVDLPASPDALSLHLVVPAFMISELRTGFEVGFLIFLPFILIDLVVASVLTALGMMMLPPTMIATPLKILVFVLVDGWALVMRAIVGGYAT